MDWKTALRQLGEVERALKAKEGVINVLNAILSADTAAISQYFVHAKLCLHWGYERLHRKLRERSIDVMTDADALIGHILYLEAVPKVHRLPAFPLGETVSEQVMLTLKTEQELLVLLSDGVRHCTTVADFTTRHLLEDRVKDVDAQIDWLEMQLDMIRELGIEQYLAEQITETR